MEHSVRIKLTNNGLLIKIVNNCTNVIDLVFILCEHSQKKPVLNSNLALIMV